MTHPSSHGWHQEQSEIDWNDCSIEVQRDKIAVVLSRGNDALFVLSGESLGICKDTPDAVCIARATPIFEVMIAMRNRSARRST